MKRYLGFVALAISLAGFVAAWLIESGPDGLPGDFHADPVGQALLDLALIAFPVVGSLIVFRQPGNAMGWVFSGIGFLVGAGAFAEAYAEGPLAVAADPGAVGLLAAWVLEWWWFPLLGLVMIFTTYLFPSGRVLSRWWRIPFLIGVAAVLVTTLAGMIQPTFIGQQDDGEITYVLDNPVGVSLLGDPEEGPLSGPVFVAFAITALLGVISLVVRFFRSRGVERQQLKWFAFGALLIPVNIFGEGLLADLIGETNALFAVAIGALPVSAGIAILRYRLYEIDVVINRALVYGSLTAILGGLYVGLVFAMQALLQPFTSESDLAIAASTLAVAALFRPVRARVQQFIDHRFYRRKFNAEHTIEEFSAGLRDEVELDAITAELVEIVRHTMQPAHISLWLRRA